MVSWRGFWWLAIVVLALVAPAPLARAATPTPRALVWGACPAATPPSVECATLVVPLDWNAPDGPAIELGLHRLAATDPDQRIGALLFNPGGPGSPATRIVDVEAALGGIFSPELRARFDLVGLDPRGVGASSPIACDPTLWNEARTEFPRDEASFAAMIAANAALGASCLDRTGPLLAHVDTTNAARDIEAVRLALGGEPLNFLGLSYGTLLGATYASLFPDAIRVMALDGALDYPLSPTTMLADESAAYADVFGRFADWCAGDPACALHGEDVRATFDALVASADAAPIPAPDCQVSQACRPAVTGEDILFRTQELLIFEPPLPAFGVPGWPGLARALVDARNGDASAFSRTLVTGKDSYADSVEYAGLAIACLDWPSPVTTFDDVVTMTELGHAFAPHTLGASQTWDIQTRCAGWPIAGRTFDLPEVHGAPPIMIVNATHDPSTSYVWAHGLRARIDGAELLTREGNGHTSYLLPGPTRDAIDAYLIGGVLPPDAH
jgi:pimeloyl-ACP methyl ester carboxylesterase